MSGTKIEYNNIIKRHWKSSEVDGVGRHTMWGPEPTSV